MRPTDLFIRRPVLAVVLSLLILLLGVRSLAALEIRQYPLTGEAVVTVQTAYVGADAALVQGFVTTPLERSIASADGIDYLESTSLQGVSVISAHLRLGYDVNAALTQITSKVNRVRNDLPQEAEVPTVDLSVGESTASLYASFSSDRLANNQITDYLSRVVQPRLQAVPGVQEVQILGARTLALRVWLDPRRMAALGVTPGDVRQALADQNVLAAVGRTKGTLVALSLDADTDLHTPRQFERLVLRRAGDRLLRLEDVARVELGAEDYETSVYFNGRNATFLGVSVLPGANPLEVVRQIRAELPAIQAQLPPGLEGELVYDATRYIEDAIREVLTTLVEAAAIVVVVIFLFLGSWRAILVPLVAIPLSIVGAGTLMLALGYSINLLTLLGMVLAIGLVVDDAIVVVENIRRHTEEGLAPREAALVGARELGGPVVAMTVTLVAVYAPIGFMGGLTGSLFREFAFTLAGAVLISGVIALTLSPLMCARLLESKEAEGRLVRALERGFGRLRDGYRELLGRALARRRWVLALGGLVLASCWFLYRAARSELAPEEDQGILLVQTTGAPDASIDQMDRWTRAYPRIFGSFPETSHSFILNGAAGGASVGQSNQGFAGMVLVPWGERARTTMQLQPLLQRELGGVPGVRAAVFARPPLPGAGRGLPVQLVITSVDPPLAVFEASQAVLRRAEASGLFSYVDSDLKYDRPQVTVHVDRDRAADLDIDMRALGGDLSTMLGGDYVDRLSIAGRAYEVIPQVERRERLTPRQLGRYHVRGRGGELVPLDALVQLGRGVRPEALRRFQQLDAATISAVPAPGVTLGQALDFLRRAAREELPADYRLDYAGQSRQYVQEGGSLVVTFFFALVIIYLALSAQFESFRDPLIMLVSVPMSISGALLFLALGASTLNIYTEVGLVTLIGLVSKHGILIVQFANQLQAEQGLGREEAVQQAAAIRLRPVLMTTAAMVVGVVPLLRARGAGAGSRFAIGLVISSGMLIGTAFTLFVVPAVYATLARRHRAEEAGAS
ncbi:MAG: efflux RND transporter permease subunit [Planctomycetota bacterium]